MADSLSPNDISKLLRVGVPPNTTAKAGWQIDSLALANACEQLGIIHPVRVRFQSGIFRWGTHYSRCTNGEYWHRICINQRLTSLDNANQTMWHELTHAAQAEEFSRETGKPITKWHEWYDHWLAKGEWGNTYRGNKFEIAANKAAKDNAHIYIIKEGDSRRR
jgi:hypothetical protein